MMGKSSGSFPICLTSIPFDFLYQRYPRIISTTLRFKYWIPLWIWCWICYEVMNNNTMTEMISESLRCQWVRRRVKWWPRAVQRRCRWQSSGRWLSVQGRPRRTRTRLDAVDATVTRQTEPGDGLDRQRTTSATVPRPRRRADGTWRGQWTRFSCGRRSSAARSPP